MIAQVLHDAFLLSQLDLEVILEGFHVGQQLLVRVRNVGGLALDTPLERLKDVRLHVI